jgi:hypothetical protein
MNFSFVDLSDLSLTQIDSGMDSGTNESCSIGMIAVLFLCYLFATTTFCLAYDSEIEFVDNYGYVFATRHTDYDNNDDDDDDDDDDNDVQDMDGEHLPVVDFHNEDDDDDDDDGVEDMDWESTPGVAFYYSAHLPVKSKARVLHVGRTRTSPLYWRHPLWAMVEYKAASRIRSPGRSFKSAGRPLATIPEGVHFFSEVVTEIHIVPRDRRHEIARGRRFDSPCSAFFSAWRALGHFFTKLASTIGTGICKLNSYVRRDAQPGMAGMGREASLSDVSTRTTSIFIHNSKSTMHSPMACEMAHPEEIQNDSPQAPLLPPTRDSVHHHEMEYVSLEFKCNPVDDDLREGTEFDNDVEPHAVDEVQEKARRDISPTQQGVLDIAEVSVTTARVALPLRRSKRLAERQERLQLQLQDQQNHETVHAGVTVPVPEPLGSVFVNGTRRSARRLTTVKSL